MKYNLTEKMKFDQDPVITIKDIEVSVKSDAETVLELLDVIENKGEMAALSQCLDLLFSPADQKKIKRLGLKMDDFVLLIQTATALAVGEDPDEEESEQGE